MNKTSLLPQGNRIVSIDIIRGFAVLGILIMNIQSFSMISAAYLNPTAYGDLTGWNKTVWVVSHVIADQKFMTIFSMLFGAGILLFCMNVENKAYKPARFFYRRLFWLFTIGLIHAYVFWHGDILVNYAICGALAFLFRRLSSWVLLALGVLLFLIPAFNYWLFGASMEMWPPESIEELRISWKPPQAVVDEEVAALSGGLASQLSWRIPEAFKMQTFVFLIQLGWRALSMMLIGMSLFKFGFFSIGYSKLFYAILAAVSFLIGYFLISTGVDKNFAAAWSVAYSMFIGSLWNYVGSFFVAIGYLSVLMLLIKIMNLNLLAKVGKMAFTNYLLMTLICTTIFYGHGFGYFGEIDRVGQAWIVLYVWLFLLLFSWVWMKYFYFGPVEWLWRFLTYGNRSKFKR